MRRLEQVLRLCGRFLVHLDFSLSPHNHRGISDPDFIQLDLQVNEDLISLLGKMCPKLEILDLRGLGRFTPETSLYSYLADRNTDYVVLRLPEAECESISDVLMALLQGSYKKRQAVYTYKKLELRSLTICCTPLIEASELAVFPAEFMEEVYLYVIDDSAFVPVISVGVF